jgi:hypothetical protein
MKFWIYIYFKFVKRSKSKAPRSDAYILFCFSIVSYFFALFAFLDAFGVVDTSWVVSGHNEPLIRFVRIPLLLSPIFIGVYVIYRLNKEKINLQLLAFEEISPEERKNRDRAYRFFISSCIFLFFFSIVAGGLLGHWLRTR